MTKRKITVVSILMIAIFGFWSCNPQTASSVKESATLNSKKSLEKPYLILISLDGFRWDYVERFKPPHLTAFIEKGVQAESLIPSFPSKTFPNHYTIATGMYPDKHGLVGNSFYSYEKKTTYAIGDREKVEDGTFYGGSPIWVTANKAGIVTASYFFVGSEADVQGIRPTYYFRYDGSVKNEARVDQVLQWLEMPEKERPHMITMYFSDMDDTGHRFGPNNDEQLKKTLMDLDTNLGKLFQGVEQSGLPVNIIIVSDHGMLEVPTEKYVPIEKVYNDDLYRTVNNGAIVSIHPHQKSQTDSIYHYLKAKEDKFKVYKTEEAPYFEYVPQNKNWGPIQIIPDPGYYFKGLRGINFNKRSDQKVYGEHGFDPSLKAMHGIFYGKGPAFKKGYTIPPIKNIHIYPLMCRILGIDIPSDIDGRLDPIKSVLEK
jgi:predicted AlkP superfamily pyrophosphatase or phosphodiesterase